MHPLFHILKNKNNRNNNFLHKTMKTETPNKAMIEPPRNSLLHQNLRALFSSDKTNKVDDHFDDDDDKDNVYYDDDDDQEQANDDHRHHRSSECSSSYFPSPNSTYMQYNHNNNYYSYPNSTASSPYLTPSPLIQLSPYQKSPWNYYNNEAADDEKNNGLIGSLYREEGHIYSIASCGGLLYTGSESRNIRVWKNMQEFSGFKSSSGLVKAIVVLGDRIFTGHQDGKIRVWRARHGGAGAGGNKYARVGTLPTTRDMLVKSVNPKNYVEVRRRKKVPWIRHYDAVSCLCVDRERGLLYSGSWDKTLKVWRVSDFKCLESIPAHDDAVNAVATASGGLLFTGSADGTVKSWRRELVGKSTRHVPVETLLRQDHAVTSLAASSSCADVLYAGSSDGLVNFWAASGEKHSIYSHGGALRGHKLAVLCLAVAGGRLVMSGSADNSICVWRWDAAVGSHSFVAVLEGHVGPVKCLAVAEEEEEEEWEKKDGWVVYSGSLDRSVKVWRVSDQVRSLSES